ncbi:hypothetical protein V8J39_00510 [Frigidibacter sp. MR17.24]
MANLGMSSEGRISSVDHAVALIEVLSERGAATVSEIAGDTGVDFHAELTRVFHREVTHL